MAPRAIVFAAREQRALSIVAAGKSTPRVAIIGHKKWGRCVLEFVLKFVWVLLIQRRLSTVLNAHIPRCVLLVLVADRRA